MRMPEQLGTIHIVGIGGIGMSAIAEVLHARGYTVQGSDQKDGANVERLRKLGMRVFVGHAAINLVGAQLVVISTAVKPGNPELDAVLHNGERASTKPHLSVAIQSDNPGWNGPPAFHYHGAD